MLDRFIRFYIEHRMEVLKRQLRMTSDPVQRSYFNDRHTAYLKLQQRLDPPPCDSPNEHPPGCRCGSERRNH